MKITILYDNEAWDDRLVSDWGFSCLIKTNGRKILFDTGANGCILLENMRKLHIDPREVDEIFISHAHWDHTGGLSDFLKIHPVRVYIPSSCPEPKGAKEVVKVKGHLKIHKNIYSTGELENVEQSLVIQQEKGVVLIVGCSHPGLGAIIKEAARIGHVYGLIGGLHGFNAFDLIRDMETICATHCTQFKAKIKRLHPEKFIEGGAGKIIEI